MTADESREPVVVLKSDDEAEMLMVEACLRAAEIPYQVIGRPSQHILTVGKAGYSLIGPMRVAVPSSLADEARAVLSDFREDHDETDED